jgi:hypothetical protein
VEQVADDEYGYPALPHLLAPALAAKQYKPGGQQRGCHEENSGHHQAEGVEGKPGNCCIDREESYTMEHTGQQEPRQCGYTKYQAMGRQFLRLKNGQTTVQLNQIVAQATEEEG